MVSLLITKGGRVMALIQLHRFLVPIKGWHPSACALGCIVADLADKRVYATPVLEFLVEALDLLKVVTLYVINKNGNSTLMKSSTFFESKRFLNMYYPLFLRFPYMLLRRLLMSLYICSFLALSTAL